MAFPRFTVSVDVGTTTIRACLYDSHGRLLAHSSQQTTVIVSGDDSSTVEMEPEVLWKQFSEVVKGAVASVSHSEEVALTLCNQRNTFVFWDKDKNCPIGKFIVWSDGRGRKKCTQWNDSFRLKSLNAAASLFHTLSRRPRFKAAAMYKFVPSMVSCRLLAALDQNEKLRLLLTEGQLGFGCIETFLIHRLSGGFLFTTEPSNISGSGIFDPFINNYNNTIMRLFGVPLSVKVPVSPSAPPSAITSVPSNLFGHSMQLQAVLGDQQAALFGCGCWQRGDTMFSLGTGTFVLVNLGDRPHSCMREGIYPLLGWQSPSGVPVCLAQGHDQDTALILSWASSIGLFNDVSETSSMAMEAGTSGGVRFVPAFGGMQTAVGDEKACTAFMGISPSTTKQQMVRAVLESIAFRVYQIHKRIESEIKLNERRPIRICGGISGNDFICGLISTLLDRRVERVADAPFAASRGVSLLAARAQGRMEEKQIRDMIVIDHSFSPDYQGRSLALRTFDEWERAVRRCSKYY